MKKQLAILLLFFVCFLVIADYVHAAKNIVISSDKSSLSLNDELNIAASISGFTNYEKIYVKGAFFKDGSINYFGLTKFNDNWIKNSTSALSQKEIIIGNWDNTVIVKPDYSDSGFTGIGNYKFKLGFYYLTSGGNISSINWSVNDLNISLDSQPSIAPSPVDVKAPPTNKSVASVSKNPITKVPSPTISSSANTVVVSKNNAKFAKISDNTRSASEFAKIKPITDTDSVERKEVKVLGAKSSDFSLPFLLSGSMILILAAGWLVYKELKERKTI